MISALTSKDVENYLINNPKFLPKNAEDIIVSDFLKINGGVTNQLYSFSLSNKDKNGKTTNLILKVYPTDSFLLQNRRYIKEFDTLKRLDSIGFPVPKAYICEQDPLFFGYPFIILQKEQEVTNGRVRIEDFANILASFHNWPINNIGIRGLQVPENNYAFAKRRLNRLKGALSKTKQTNKMKNDLLYAVDWLDSHLLDNNCPRYSLIHGEYHPKHVIKTSEGALKVIDWESAEIGDPAFDVGYAYNMVRLMYGDGNKNSGEKAAEEFLSCYRRSYCSSIENRVEFYKVMGILGIAIEVGSWISNPLATYRRFGLKALARSIAFPFAPFHLVPKKWLNADFLLLCAGYFQDLVSTLKKQDSLN